MKSVTAFGQRRVDALIVFCERAAVKAYLHSLGEISLQEVVDTLQRDAVGSGLVARIGQDAVQAIMADAFRPYRQDAP